MSGYMSNNLKQHYLLEKKYAEEILRAPKNSLARKELIQRANDEILKMMSAYNNGAAFSHDGEFIAVLVKAILPKGAKILDFGCGEGGLVKALSRDGYEVSGFDVAAINIRNAEEKLYQSGLAEKVFLGDWQDLQGEYDAIIMDNVIEHLVPDETIDILKKCFSLLNKNGILLVVTPHRAAGPHDISKNFLPLGARAEGFHFHEFSVTELSGLLAESGFLETASYLVHPKILYRLNIFLRPRKIFCLRSLFIERVLLSKSFGKIFTLNRNLSRALVALLFPAVVVARKK